jgi:hypothetical protein
MSPEAIELLSEMLRGTPALSGAACPDWALVFEATTNATIPKHTTTPSRPHYASATAVPGLAGCTAWFEPLPHDARPPGEVAGRITERTA